jgi:novobiocin biosynthesis protein NovU/D-mycarose 3-C-methyltransferase
MKRSNCRVCDSTALDLFLDLGLAPLANRFLRPDQLGEPEPHFPLRVCLCRQCGLVQLDEEVPREVLFKDYIYVTGTSDLVHRHAQWLAQTLCRRFSLGPSDLVMEAASNDGSVLKAFQRQSVQVLGIEPAANIAAQARGDGIPTVIEFFDARVAQALQSEYGTARLFLARHVLGHVTDLQGFAAGIQTVLAEDGVAIVEVPHVATLYEKLAFDTIYHEHLCYFSVAAMQTLFARFGLALLDVEQVDIHGGSVLVQVVHEAGPYQFSRRVVAALAAEQALGLERLETWVDFAQRVGRLKRELRAFLDHHLRAGRRLAGYGAPAKGNALLSYCGIGPERLPFLVDKSRAKQRLVTPGHHIPVLDPDVLLAEQPDLTLILAWNFAAEIVEQQAEYLRRGGRFAVPVPRPHVLPAEPAAARKALRRKGART